MLLGRLIRKIRRRLYDKRRISTGRIYHHDCREIVVSEQELMIQLDNSDTQDNFMKLLIYGRELSDFETHLTRASLKFELIGDFVYPTGDKYRTDNYHPRG